MEMLTQLIIGKIDILLTSENKLDGSFPSKQFLLLGFSPPCRRDRNIHGGEIMFFIREDILSKEIKKVQNDNIECQ